jgi:cytoskeletal protein CcmA (bactofilin family)
MFKKDYEEEGKYQNENTETIVGSSVKLEGDLAGQGNVNVYGEVSGKIQTKGDVAVEKSAAVKADVEANNITVSGLIEGNVKAQEKLEVTESGKIVGDITAKTLSIAPGANFSGQCNMQAGEGEILKAEKNKNKKEKEEKEE